MVALDRAEQRWHVKVKWHIQVAAFLSFEFTRMTHEVCRQSDWATKLYGCKIVRSWWSDAGLLHLLLLRTTTFYLQPYYYNVLLLLCEKTYDNVLRTTTTLLHATTILQPYFTPYCNRTTPYCNRTTPYCDRTSPNYTVLLRTTKCYNVLLHNHWSIILKIDWWG